MGSISELLVHCITCTTRALAVCIKFLAPLSGDLTSLWRLANNLISFWCHCREPNKSLAIHQQRYKFLVLLPGKVRFSVWIDILAKEKFDNLNEYFLFLFSFVSYLYLIYYIFSFILYFSFKCLA